MVESRCGAVALGRTYLLPPLSFGGALMARPWPRFHIPLIGRVEGWRAGVARESRLTQCLPKRPSDLAPDVCGLGRVTVMPASWHARISEPLK